VRIADGVRGASGQDGERVANERDDDEREVGVGPWPGSWPEGAEYDPELLEHGDRRNVVDGYRYWRLDAIVADLDARRHPFHVAIENWAHDLNIGSVVRTANAFLAADDEFAAWAGQAGLPVIGIDNLPGSVPLEGYRLPRECVLVFGQEGAGLSDAVRAMARDTLSIAQFGSTRSINAGAAAAIAMHSWIEQHAQPRVRPRD